LYAAGKAGPSSSLIDLAEIKLAKPWILKELARGPLKALLAFDKDKPAI
jgi:hypothetical protein